MTTIFAYNALPHNPAFGSGLSLERKPRRPRPDRLDVAWYLGFNSCREEGPNVQPPADFNLAETHAFDAGVGAAVMGAADMFDDLIERLEDIEHDKAACGF